MTGLKTSKTIVWVDDSAMLMAMTSEGDGAVAGVTCLTDSIELIECTNMAIVWEGVQSLHRLSGKDSDIFRWRIVWAHCRLLILYTFSE